MTPELQEALKNPAMAQALNAMVNQMLQGGAVPLIVGGKQSNVQPGRQTQMFRDPKNGALYPRNEEFEMTEGLEPVLCTCQENGQLKIEKVGETLRKEGDGMILMTQAVEDENGNETGTVTTVTGLTGGFKDDEAVNSPLRKRIARRAAAAKGDELAADGVLAGA